ncbi:glycosyltransferase [Neobacillus niacini]|uniref:glycosyltransferase n=1 Tax=Neobacillus niacini TaxID=86668 RepID=UPI001C8DF1D9|nr:glycosyltransferase [Neobacillus niacini]MBY0145123.1 glycosyltransferase [Neobacillus niacini]
MEKKKKILIVHNYYQIPGGEDTVVANEKKLLEEHGHQVVLYSRNNNELKGMAKLQKLCIPFSTVFSIRTYREVKNIIIKEKIDVVHVHNTLNLISPSVYYAAFSKNKPVIQTIHNFRLLCPAATFYREGRICEDCVDKGLKCAVSNKCYRGSRLQTLGCVFTLKLHRLLGTYKKLNYICLTEFNKEKLLMLNKGKKQLIDPNKVFVKPNFK